MNTARNWVVPKVPVVRAVQLAGGLAAVAVLVPGCEGGGLNPFNLVGAEFLVFLIPVLVGAMVAGRIVRNLRRVPGPHPGDEDRELSWEQAAYLAGGIPRLTTAAIARLAGLGALRELQGVLTRADGVPSRGFSPVEHEVLNHLPIRKTELKPLGQAVEARFAPEAARLEAEGFALPAGRRFWLGASAFVPVLLVQLGLGLPRLVMGLANDKPVGYLVATLLFGGFVGLIVAFAGNPRLTLRGEAVMRAFRKRHAALVGTKDGADVGLAVVLFGTAALAGTAVAYLTDWYPRKTATGADSGCGGGCGTTSGGCGAGDGGGGGGCGGGCGGCGGGGGD